jgi:hypothetical protein
MTDKLTAKTVYQTTDGQRFDTQKEAEGYQRALDATANLHADQDFFYNAINVCSGVGLKEFLERNADWIKPMMGWK